MDSTTWLLGSQFAANGRSSALGLRVTLSVRGLPGVATHRQLHSRRLIARISTCSPKASARSRSGIRRTALWATI